ncbi:MAG: MBL fold metallo-hydrolase [Rhodoferax sp.]|nr:MBL fold metallo-hydrolase [Rhodoferax sp.]
MNLHKLLPPGLTVLERGWLSSNSILIKGQRATALVDSGYCTHAPQTLALVQAALGGRALDRLVNTHLHSDHCGGNAALQAAYPCLRTLVPPGHAAFVRHWNPDQLSYTPTGQQCPQFQLDDVLQPGADLTLGDLRWQVHAAPGHDPHSVLLFEPASRCLLSADALWQRGFGVVFPELEDEGGFADVAATLDLIEALTPLVVVPGHGAPFTDVTPALAFARSRLDAFVANPARHLAHAAKVLLKFKLLDAQRMTRADLQAWALGTPYLQRLFARQSPDLAFAQGLDVLVRELVRAGAATLQAGVLHNA